ncbi:hypothetical protein HPB50_012893 [Hyalomma asiaticum]|uniref:Uncharacterized protein n=1 Tax=Hyalomma asiaticum TaxID=266040 RepID=A0ACB7S2S3_HYAAI|nr:hypothetical protein HPB50_012893 [Hyalomma asiaticum]
MLSSGTTPAASSRDSHLCAGSAACRHTSRICTAGSACGRESHVCAGSSQALAAMFIDPVLNCGTGSSYAFLVLTYGSQPLRQYATPSPQSYTRADGIDIPL